MQFQTSRWRPATKTRRGSSGKTSERTAVQAKGQNVGLHCGAGKSEPLDREAFQMMISEGLAERRPFVDEYISKVVDHPECEAAPAILNAAKYYDDIGDPTRAVEVCKRGLEIALVAGDPHLIRKAHSVAGILQARVCDFESSFAHFDNALKLAYIDGRPLYIFAVLSNISSALQSMGLLQSAKEISIKLAHFATDDDPQFIGLHLQNAINGAELAELTNDASWRTKFTELARENINKLSQASVILTAFVQAREAVQLIRIGDPERAFSFIQDAIDSRKDRNNVRALSILCVARATCVVAAPTKERLSEALNALLDLLSKVQTYPVHQEDLLRSIVKLYLVDKSSVENTKALHFVKKLNQLVINVKHGRFYDRISRQNSEQTFASLSLQRSSYRVPDFVALKAQFDDTNLSVRAGLTVEQTETVNFGFASFTEPTRQKLEGQFRSEMFEIAEDWAVAAEAPGDGGGWYCFCVGRLAGAIMLRLGHGDEYSVRVEMASRLHEIGKISFDKRLRVAVARGELDEEVLRDHGRIGQRLLASHEDCILDLAAVIARSHHEWWNGLGYPDGLQGVQIPLEARVCAVADAYVRLTNPRGQRVGWSSECVAKQLKCMSGVQLDPEIVGVFLSCDLQDSPAISGHAAAESDKFERVERKFHSLLATIAVVDG